MIILFLRASPAVSKQSTCEILGNKMDLLEFENTAIKSFINNKYTCWKYRALSTAAMNTEKQP